MKEKRKPGKKVQCRCGGTIIRPKRRNRPHILLPLVCNSCGKIATNSTTK